MINLTISQWSNIVLVFEELTGIDLDRSLEEVFKTWQVWSNAIKLRTNY